LNFLLNITNSVSQLSGVYYGFRANGPAVWFKRQKEIFTTRKQRLGSGRQPAHLKGTGDSSGSTTVEAPTTHHHALPTLRISGAIHSLPPTP